MNAIAERVRTFLDAHHAAYETIHHEPDYTAQMTAAHTHTPGVEFAKTVLLKVDGEYMLAALPAHHRILFEVIQEALGAWEVRLATEDELKRLFPDCDLGAEPPLGNLYDMPVLMSQAMVFDRSITFNAGTHEEAVRMSEEDFLEWVRPRVIDFSRPE